MPIKTGFMSSTAPTTAKGDLPSLHSPYPVTPSSVSTFTNIHGRHPASTVKVSMPTIFMKRSSARTRRTRSVNSLSERSFHGLIAHQSLDDGFYPNVF